MRAAGLSARKLGQAFYKIGLGLVALDEGQDAARDSRYDAARDLIFGRREFPNTLLMLAKPEPSGQVFTHLDRRFTGTPLVLGFYGLVVLLNLEPAPRVKLAPEMEKLGFVSFVLDS
jgi:hypothetical protein